MFLVFITKPCYDIYHSHTLFMFYQKAMSQYRRNGQFQIDLHLSLEVILTRVWQQ